MALALLWGGIAVYLAGVVWLIYLAWTNDEPLMAVGIFCLAPVFGLVYAISHWAEARVPYILVLIGFGMRVAGMAMTD
jgi:hypothetical protein